jgi:calcineurin-like phosphoesterase family protein
MRPRALRPSGTVTIVLLMLVVLVSGPASASSPEPPQVEAAWLQFGPDGSLLLRAITHAEVCPSTTIGKRTVPMTERAAPGPAFPVRSCEAVLPTGERRADVAGRRLLAPDHPPRRIAVIGDTGCRLKQVDGFQACNDPRAWPFARIARSLAEYHPDLILDVGDYLYREEPCPAGDAGCAGSPWGQNWDTWAADFFTPAAPALAAAPWVLVRGDHESCARAGEGWFRFLEPRPAVSCTDATDPYTVPLGGLRLLVMDTVRADDTHPDPAIVADFAQQFSALSSQAGDDAWLLSHRPLWGLEPAMAGAGLEVPNATLQQASNNMLPPGVQLVLTGHIHLAEVLSFGGARAPQLVAGIGGTLLLPDIDQDVVGMDVAGAVLTSATITSEHGFVTFEREPHGWSATLRGVDGRPQPGGRCRLEHKEAVCQ